MPKITLSNDKVVEMREPLVRDIRAVSHIEQDDERELALIANLTGMSSEELDALTYADYLKLQEEYLGFLG